MTKLIDRKVLIIASFVLILPYLFRIFNLDLIIINFLKSQNFLLMNEKKINQNKIVLGYVEFYPYTFTNAENNPDGVFIEKARKIFSKLQDYELEFVSLPASRLFEGLKSGDIQLFIGVTTIPVLQEVTIHTESKLGTIEMRVYSLNQHISVNKKEDLKGKRVILVKGYAYSGWAEYLKRENPSFIIEAIDHEIAFEMLLRNRGEYLLEYKEPAENVIKKLNLNNIYFSSLMMLDCYFIISKKYSKAEILKRQLEEKFKILK